MEIIQHPPPPAGEPWATWFLQRNEAFAEVLGGIVSGNVQIGPMRALLRDEILFDGPNDLIYGTVVHELADGYKSALYRLGSSWVHGLATMDLSAARGYGAGHFAEGNEVRIKIPTSSGGEDQAVAGNDRELIDIITGYRSADKTQAAVRKYGLVVMPNLAVTDRISVGFIDLGAAGRYQYVGREVFKPYQQDGLNINKYGGITLGLWRLDEDLPDRSADILEELEISPKALEAGLEILELYLKRVQQVGRVSVDVIQGFTGSGQRLTSGVDVTPRPGGASSAELVAIEALQGELGGLCMAQTIMSWDPSLYKIPRGGIDFVKTPTLEVNARVLGVH